MDLDFLGTRARNISAIIALLVTLSVAFWWLAGDKVQSIVQNLANPPSPQQCIRIPPSGHSVESARPGEWATVTWINIERFDGCAKPEISGVVANGDGIYHDVEMSISGVRLDNGINPEFRYQFKIPESAQAGRAWFRVTLDYPEQGRSVNTPRIHFVIMDPPK